MLIYITRNHCQILKTLIKMSEPCVIHQSLSNVLSNVVHSWTSEPMSSLTMLLYTGRKSLLSILRHGSNEA